VLEKENKRSRKRESYRFAVMFLFIAVPCQYIEPLVILMHRRF